MTTKHKLRIVYIILSLSILLSCWILVYLVFLITLITGTDHHIITLNTYNEQLIEAALLTFCIPGILSIYFSVIHNEQKKFQEIQSR